MSKLTGLYSVLDEAAKNIKRGSGPGQAFINDLKKAGVKPAELKERGLDKIAEIPKLTKMELVKKIEAAPPPKLRETINAEPHKNDVRARAEEMIEQDAYDEANVNRWNRHEQEDVANEIAEYKMEHEFDDYLDRAREELSEDGGKYKEYTLPGGENYREILMRLPSPKSDNAERVMQLEAKQRRGSLDELEAQELASLQEQAKNSPEYHSKHWGEPNVLAHMRVTDRVVPTYTKKQAEEIGQRIAEGMGVDNHKNLGNGAMQQAVNKGLVTPKEAAQYADFRGFQGVDKTGARQKVLHVEEIQSDWHQEGKERGYRLPPEETAPMDSEYRALVHKNSDARAAGLEPNPKDVERAKQLEAALLQSDSSKIPNAPFKENWHELAMKRLLNYAAENGYDKIAITPGAEQAKRYDLSKQISKVRYFDDPNSESGVLHAYDLEGNNVLNQRMSQSELEQHIGKDAAKKLLAQQIEENERTGYPSQQRTLSGLDLQTGGEGMTHFYDQRLPSFLNKYGQPHGVQVSPFDIITHPEKSTAQVAAPGIGYFPEPVVEPARTAITHGFDITPEMREELISKGLPLYKRGGSIKKRGRVHVSQNPDTMLLDLMSRS
jgi:hypothetical protein